MAKDIEMPKGEEVDDLKLYEIGYLIVPRIAEDEVAREVSRIMEAVEQCGGIRTSDEFPTLRPLAYDMQKKHRGAGEKFGQAYFGWIKFEMLPDQVMRFKESLRVIDTLLRFIVMRTMRENALFGGKLSLTGKTAAVLQLPVEGEASTARRKAESTISDEELDRSLEGLIAE